MLCPRFCPTVLTAIALFGTPALAASLAPVQNLPHESLASQLLAEYGYAEATPETFDLHEFVATACLHVPVGIYDLYLPADAAADEDAVEEYQRVALALLDAQELWLDWLEDEVEDERALKQARQDHKTLVKWIKGWRARTISAGAEEGSRSLLDALSAKDSLREACERHAEYHARGEALSLGRHAGVREPIVLVQDRVRMVQLCSLGGWIYPTHRNVFWQPGIKTWTHFYIDDVKFLATRLANPRGPADYATGASMDSRTETGLEQQVVQLATNSMLANYYGDAIPPTLAGGLSINLVIDLFGECNTRADGDLRARRASAREVFVPGGLPSGGILPPNMADSRWRSEHGADHFTAALRRAMPSARRGVAKFVLEDDRGRRKAEVVAPFLGSAAIEASSPIDGEYHGDHLEFLRAYRSCFLNWLREAGAGSSKRSSQAYASLLKSLARPGEASIEGVLTTVYGSPLSSAEPGDEDLEGRFLEWLAKQR